MKQSWQVMLIAALLAIAFSSGHRALAQQVPIAGGYGEISTSDPEVLAAARFAIRRQSRIKGASISLISIKRAEVQVVSGLNYKLSLRVRAKGKTEDVTAVVYKNLKRKYALTSWEVEGGSASSTASRLTIEQLAKSFADNYTAKTLGNLDAERPLNGKVRVVIEHSLAEDNSKEQFERRTFRTFAQVERWLRSREISEGIPNRNVMPFVSCRKGACTYNFDGGILHNNLYLQEIRYSLIKGRPLIGTIYLLDGD